MRSRHPSRDLLELLVGQRDPPIVIARMIFGVGVPAGILIYGLLCIVRRQATIIARGGLTQIVGLPAISIGIGYLALALAAYVFICWDDHPRFAGLRDATLQLLLLVIAAALAATFGLVLI